MWTTAGGIAVTFAGLIIAVLVWLVNKLRGRDLFDHVMRQAETEGIGRDLGTDRLANPS